jgi:hypothetical protein
MKRRKLLKSLSAGVLLAPVASLGFWVSRPTTPVIDKIDVDVDLIAVELHDPESQVAKPTSIVPQMGQQAEQWDRVSQFDDTFNNDVFLTSEQMCVLESVLTKMTRLQKHLGHGNFSLLGYDNMLRYARQFPHIGAFTALQQDFLDEIFHHDANQYGFMGKKVMPQLTTRISIADTLKVPGTGQYLYRGESEAMYQRLGKDIGPTMVLTSGIRGMAKQLNLFLTKTHHTGGNLSRASRSLAPPGHSYHGVGDFDIGQINLGSDNFTARFSNSKAYKRLQQLDYINIRYTSNNLAGVRFEPWHIKVVT